MIANLWIEECKAQLTKPRRRITTTTKKRPIIITNTTNILPRPHISWTRSVSTRKEAPATGSNNKLTENKDDILTAALDQSNASIAHSLIDNTFTLIRRGSPELAWECYHDLTSRHIQRYVSRDQYRRLISVFNHTKSNQAQKMEYILTLVEDMKKLGYSVGRKEKLLLMRALGLNGNLSAMEKIFEDLKNEDLLFVSSTDNDAVQKPFNILLTCYAENDRLLSPEVVAEKSMAVYGEMLDRNIQPASSITHILMSNIKLAERTDETVEKVWEWLWTKIGMNMAGKTTALDPILYRDMVMYFASAGRPEYALEINDIMTKRKIPRTVPMMTALMHKVGRAGDIDRAMELLDEMLAENLMPTLVTFNALIDIHAHKKPEPDITGATRIYNMLSEVGLQPDVVTFGTLIDMFSKQGELSGAKKLFYDMKSRKIMPTPYIFSSFIELFIQSGDHEAAMDIVKLLKKQSDRGLPPAREAYNLMFKGLVQNELILEAIMLLNVMAKEDMGLEARTFNPLMNYYARRGDPEGARKVAAMMTQASVMPSSFTYTILLNSYAKAGDIEGAESIFDILKTKYRLTSQAYNALLYVYTKNNAMEKVLDTYKRMSKSVPVNEYTYGILMNFYSRRKEVRAAESLMTTMESNNIIPSPVCWTVLMQTYFECDRPEDGRRVMDRMLQAGWKPSNVSWSVMINGYIQSDQLDSAESVLTEILERSKQSISDTQKHHLLKDTKYENYEKRVPETLEDVLNRSAANGLKPKNQLSSYLFAPIIDAYGKLGDSERAKALYKKMCDLSVPTTVPVYTILMNIFDNESNHAAVESMWKALYKNDATYLEHLDPIFEERPIPVPKMEYNYINLLTLDEEDLLEVEKSVIRKQASPFALSIYLNSLINQNRIEDVKSLWNQLSSEGYEFDEHNWNKYISGLVEDGNLDDACRVISKEFFGDFKDDSVTTIKNSPRKRDDIFLNDYGQLHNHTCILLAAAFEIPGAEFMGEPRLRSVVTSMVKEHMNRLDSLDR